MGFRGTTRRGSAQLGTGCVAGALALALAVAGCTTGEAHAATRARSVTVTESDFRISVAPAHISSGDVDVSVTNRGPTSHELILVRSRRGALPLRADGITIDEDALESSTLVSLDPGPRGSVRTSHIHLTPGRYELFCNMSGHYFGGMHAELVVT